MITSEEALKIINERMPQFGNGKTSENILADRDYPPFNRVMMDGIALSWETFNSGKKEFMVKGIAPAGAPMAHLEDGQGCFEVMTGAPLPSGATLVIPYEHISLKDGLASITVEAVRKEFDNVHLMGSDAKKGDVLLQKDSLMNGPHWGIAKSVGYSTIKKDAFPRVNIISTGDELVEVESTPLPHQIRRSNVYALKASLNLFGYEDVTLSHLQDKVEAIENHFQDAKDRFDVLIYSGGVSKGKYDYLPSTLKSLGVTEYIHGITQRPGKPLWFGFNQKSLTAVFGLPGNPVSSLVCLHKYFLKQRPVYAQLSEEIVFKNSLTYFVPVKIEYTNDGIMKAIPLRIKNSGEFTALAGSDGFLELPKDQEVFKAGEAYPYHSWRPV